jgi:hypothetical protein
MNEAALANGFSKYPLDFDQLEKGETLTCERLEVVTGKKPGTDAYRFAILGLQALIHERTPFTAKTQADGSLRILTDAEASDHNDKLVSQGVRTVIFRHARAIVVDVGNLTEDQKARHDQRLQRQGRYVTALLREQEVTRIEQKPSKRLEANEDSKFPADGRESAADAPRTVGQSARSNLSGDIQDNE